MNNIDAKKIYRQVEKYNEQYFSPDLLRDNLIHFLVNANSYYHLNYIKSYRRQEYLKGLDINTSLLHRMKIHIRYPQPIVSRFNYKRDIDMPF